MFSFILNEVKSPLIFHNGKMIGAHDLIIAATALRYDYAVLTANLSEFERVPNLNVLPLLAEKTKLCHAAACCENLREIIALLKTKTGD